MYRYALSFLNRPHSTTLVTLGHFTLLECRIFFDIKYKNFKIERITGKTINNK